MGVMMRKYNNVKTVKNTTPPINLLKDSQTLTIKSAGAFQNNNMAEKTTNRIIKKIGIVCVC